MGANGSSDHETLTGGRFVVHDDPRTALARVDRLEAVLWAA